MTTINYRFKRAIQEELARLETISLQEQQPVLSTVISRDYAARFMKRTMKRHTSRSRFSISSFFFHSFSFR